MDAFFNHKGADFFLKKPESCDLFVAIWLGKEKLALLHFLNVLLTRYCCDKRLWGI